ncbi:hypothetical protein J32TS6_34330 [Virgibacillus pantothenticus]|nr:hypothetical protein J32TS6_34330 [Virgibacillus pantothenticus]SIT11068.1 hypothetical protein SAMN05421787_11710 [Virgibacillus pantothenticus]
MELSIKSSSVELNGDKLWSIVFSESVKEGVSIEKNISYRR